MMTLLSTTVSNKYFWIAVHICRVLECKIAKVNKKLPGQSSEVYGQQKWLLNSTFGIKVASSEDLMIRTEPAPKQDVVV